MGDARIASPAPWWAAPGLIGLAVEFTWAVQEAVIIPYLLWLGVPLKFAGVSYLLNPLFGLFLQPWIGAWSDRVGKRKPFLAVLATTGTLGLVVLMFSYEIGAFVLQGGDRVVTAVALTGFTVSDISHDCLLVPARAMVQDSCRRSTDERNKQNAAFSKLQVLGRLLALAIGIFSIGELVLPQPVIDPLPEDSLPVVHMMALAALAIVVLVGTTTAVLVGTPAETRDGEDDNQLGDGWTRPSPRSSVEAVPPSERDERLPLLPPGSRDGYASTSDSSVLTPIVVALPRHPSSLSHASALVRQTARRRALFGAMMAVHFYGWVANMVQVFYWTAFLHGSSIYFQGVRIRIAYLGLTTGALVACGASFMLRRINASLGPLVTYFLAELVLMCALMLVAVTGDGLGTVAVCGLTGLFYVVHVNNPFLILHAGRDDKDSDDDEDDSEVNLSGGGPGEQANAWVVSVISAAMPAAQIVVGVGAGYVLDGLFQKDFAAFFAAVGFVGFVFDLLCVAGLVVYTRAHTRSRGLLRVAEYSLLPGST